MNVTAVLSAPAHTNGNACTPFAFIAADGSVCSEVTLPAEELRAAYRWLLLTRELDTRLLSLQRQGRIGFYAPCTGEEAAQVGSALALQQGDWTLSQYREPGAALVRGMPLVKLLCHMYGNVQDPLQGRQMPSHFGWKEAHFVPASSPVGTQIPIATGVAWASKLKHESAVTLVYFGEGATSTGDFHVSMNLAGVFQLPLVFLCKNNAYAISTAGHQQTAVATMAEKAAAYGFAGVRVDGNDVLAMLSATRAAVELARQGGGPTLIEAVTYRMGPHSTADDPRRYRSEAEVEQARQRDPVERMRRYLAAQGVVTVEQDAELRAAVAHEIEAAIQSAEKVESPPLDSIFHDVYAEMPWHLREQMAELVNDPTYADSEAPNWGGESDDYKFP